MSSFTKLLIVTVAMGALAMLVINSGAYGKLSFDPTSPPRSPEFRAAGKRILIRNIFGWSAVIALALVALAMS